MIWISLEVPVKNMLAWGTLDERGRSFVISHDLTGEEKIYRASYKLSQDERAKPFVSNAVMIGDGFPSLEAAKEACKLKSAELK